MRTGMFVGRSIAVWCDGVAICASTLCMMHCLALPLLLALLPAAVGGVAQDERVHLIALALAVPTSGLALVAGWRRHRTLAPLALGLVGLLAMAAGVALASEGPWETGLTVAGSLLVAGGHVANWRSRKQAAAIGEPCA